VPRKSGTSDKKISNEQEIKMAVNTNFNPGGFQAGASPLCKSATGSAGPCGVISSSNLGEISSVSFPGGAPSPSPGVIPINASGVPTININIFSGGGMPALPGAGLTPPNWPQPSFSGSTQTIDATRSYWENYLNYLKTRKELVAAELEKIVQLQQEVQLKLREMEPGNKEEDADEAPHKIE